MSSWFQLHYLLFRQDILLQHIWACVMLFCKGVCGDSCPCLPHQVPRWALCDTMCSCCFPFLQHHFFLFPYTHICFSRSGSSVNSPKKWQSHPLDKNNSLSSIQHGISAHFPTLHPYRLPNPQSGFSPTRVPQFNQSCWWVVPQGPESGWLQPANPIPGRLAS